jgi:hypothetical protein
MFCYHSLKHKFKEFKNENKIIHLVFNRFINLNDCLWLFMIVYDENHYSIQKSWFSLKEFHV